MFQRPWSTPRLAGPGFSSETTIRFGRGAPPGLQVTDSGDMFLRSDYGGSTGIFLINADRESGAEPAKAMLWAGALRQNALVLSPNQTRLFASCFITSPSS